jgi:thiol:disulfide interchange protein DsbD
MLRSVIRTTLPAFALAGTLAAISPATAQPAGLDVESKWVFDADGVHPSGTIRGALKIVIPGKFHVQSDKPDDEFLIPTILTVTTPGGIAVAEIAYPEPIMLDVEMISDQPLPVFEREFVIGVAFEISVDLVPDTYPISLSLGYQACDDKICLQPETLELDSTLTVVTTTTPITQTGNPLFDEIVFTGTPPPVVVTSGPIVVAPTPVQDCDVVAALDRFEIMGTAGGLLGVDDFIEFIEGAETGTIQTDWFADKGPWFILGAIVLGGIALNLTPCVLPMIPINLAIIGAGAQSGSRRRGFALGGTYGIAMAAVYGVLGLIVILTTATFGAINSTIWFNVGIAALFVVLGLAMFDIVHVDFSKWQGKFDAAGMGKKGSFALAFGMGGISALLAGACVAPVVIQVIVYASDQYAKGSTLALALPFFLGFGMAIPWPFAGAGLSLLPKPGMWMVRVKQLMGVFILAFAVYYGYLAWGIFDNRRVDPDAVAASVQEQLEGGWTASICQGLATAEAENKPVLIDMWATWCKNCLAMDKRTFKDEAVVARLDGYVKIKFQAQELKESPAREMIEMFEQVGLPAYAILRPKP